MNTPLIGFAGMTHLGLNSAVATASRGFSVVCFDQDATLIQNLTQQKLPINEPQLPEFFAKNFKKLTFSANPEALKTCDIVYISTDVPTNEYGQSDLSPIEALINIVSKQLRDSAILVILCQVPPGFTRKQTFPKERVYYQVETLIFGRALERALYPERFIIGCHEPSKPLPDSFVKLLIAFNCPILPMQYESAELAKISINCCLVASVTVANTLSEICEHIGADWSEIVPALKLDKRIGDFAYLAPGLGIAGGNLERDLNTVLQLSEQHGTETSVINAWIKNSRYRRDWVLTTLHQKVLSKIQNPTIAVLGLAYKENTHSTKNSPSLALLNALFSYFIKVYDPLVLAKDIPNVQQASSVLEAAQNADVLIIMTPWAEFKTLDPAILSSIMKHKIIIDPYRVLNEQKFSEAKFDYFTLGKSTTQRKEYAY